MTKSKARIKRVYAEPSPKDGKRILVDRLWPRGLTKERARVDIWLKEVAPSTELRKWFGHDPAKWIEFKARYRKELASHAEQLALLRQEAAQASITLLYGAKDEEHNEAVVLAALLRQKMNRARPNRRILRRSFYANSPEIVARALLGRILVHHREGELLSGRIVEAEAYLGLSDPASHAFTGRSPYNDVLFGPPGYADVYLIYGLHYCMNVSCLPDGEPGGVLIRALDPIDGIATMERLRGLPDTASAKLLTGGPGRLCQAMGISRARHLGMDVTDPKSILQIVDDGYRPKTIDVTPRIGISKAADRPLRFVAVK